MGKKKVKKPPKKLPLGIPMERIDKMISDAFGGLSGDDPDAKLAGGGMDFSHSLEDNHLDSLVKK